MMGRTAAETGIAGLEGTGAMFDPRSAQAFFDPFLEDVVGRTQADIARLGQQQATQARAGAVGAGAFGGSREAVLQGEIARNVLEEQARTGAQLRSQGFQQAQQAAQQAFEQGQQRAQQAAQLTGQLGQIGAGTGLTAAELGGRLGQAQAGLGLTAAQQAGQLGLSAEQLAAQAGLGAGQLGLTAADLQRMTGLGAGQLAGQQAGISQALGQGIGALGGQLAGLGTQQAQLGALQSQLMGQDVQRLAAMGEMEREQYQRVLDAARQTELEQYGQPFQQLGFVSDIFRGTPTAQMQTTTTTAPSRSMFQQIAGAGIAGLSGLAAGRKAGLL